MVIVINFPDRVCDKWNLKSRIKFLKSLVLAKIAKSNEYHYGIPRGLVRQKNSQDTYLSRRVNEVLNCSFNRPFWLTLGPPSDVDCGCPSGIINASVFGVYHYHHHHHHLTDNSSARQKGRGCSFSMPQLECSLIIPLCRFAKSL